MGANKIGFLLHILIEDPIVKKESTKLRRNKSDQLNDLELRKAFLNHEKYQSEDKINRTHYIKIGEGNGTPLQYSHLGNPMDRGAWWATSPGIIGVRHALATITTTTTSPL